MKKEVSAIVLAACLVFGGSALAEDGMAQEFGTDLDDFALAMEDIIERMRAQKMFEYEGGSMPLIFENAKTSLDRIAGFRQMRTETLAYIDVLAAEHAPDAGDLAEKMRGLRLALEAEGEGDAAGDINELESALRKMDPENKAGEEQGLAVLEDIGLAIETAGFMPPTMRMRIAPQLVPALGLVDDFDPDSKKLAKRAAKLLPEAQAAVDKMIADSMDEIAGAEWPGGDPSTEEAKAGFAHLQQHPDWGGDTDTPTEIIKVATHGEWFVSKVNILGQPLAYGMPAWIAVREPSSPEGTVNVLNISLITKGPEKTTDFGPVAVSPGMKTMLLENLPEE